MCGATQRVWRTCAYPCSVWRASVKRRTAPWWWCSSRRCPACGSCSVSRCLLWPPPSLWWTGNKHLERRHWLDWAESSPRFMSPFICKYRVTFSGFAFPHQESSSMVPWDQQQSLSIFAPHFTKIPPVERQQTHKLPDWYCLCYYSADTVASDNKVGISGNGASLFSLDGVGRGHVIAGDVACPPCGDGAGLPPVSLSA